MANRNIISGILLAVLACLIWAGNFIIARGIHDRIPAISLAFYRWCLAAIILTPFAIRKVKTEWTAVKDAGWFFFFAALTGITLFNTFVYIGGHHTTAINLSIIGTTSSPIISVILAAIFLKEKISPLKFAGLAICIAGVLYLLTKGDFSNLLQFQFTRGDIWVLLAGFVFAIYNTMVKKRPKAISPVSFLWITFSLGTILLLPAYIWELFHSEMVVWDYSLVLIILYLAIGASIISFMIWNIAIYRLGAGRTALFGNLIPVFSSIEAWLILHETITWVHVISFAIVICGLLLANFRK